jgi:hypothetical protein
MLKTISVGLTGGGGGNGTVTQVGGTGTVNGITLTGNVTSSGNLTLGGTLGNIANSQLTNSAVTIGNTSVSLGSTVTNIGNLTLANVTITSGSVPAANVTGLGTMATQNANAVVITGGNATLTTITANNHVATANIATTTTAAAYSYGTLSYTDTNMFASYSTNIGSYAQVVLQNISNNASASIDFVVSNDQGTSSTNYGDFGMNSSAYSGTGNFQKAGAVYLYAASTDLSIGTWSASAIHFIAGGNTNADAMTVNANNTVTIATLAQSTSSTATFATSSLPLVPAGYIIVNNNGTNVKIPYYAV